MELNVHRLQRLLALTSSDHDGEALQALRRARDLMKASGMDLEDLARPAAVMAAASRAELGSEPDCRDVLVNGTTMLEVRPAAPAVTFPLPRSAVEEAEEIARRFREALIRSTAAHPPTLQIRLELVGINARLWADVPGNAPIELWTGDRDAATALQLALRRATAHALRFGGK